MKCTNKCLALLTALAVCFGATGCSDEYDDSVLTERIEALENRMKELEELCKRLNEN